MKIFCFTKDMHFLRYFVNQVHDAHGVALCVLEDAPVPWLWLKKRRNRLLRREEYRRYERLFGEQGRCLANDISVLRVPDINHPQVSQVLQRERPDVVLDHGTSIVRNEVLALAPLTMNIHWGLSPYYRGSFCTEWALMNRDPWNIGVTVHKLAAEVDGGDVLAQERALLQGGDTVHAINMRLTMAGVRLVNKALQQLTGSSSFTVDFPVHQ